MFVYVGGTRSSRQACGWTTLAMLLTNSWLNPETGRIRPPVNVAGAHGWPFKTANALTGAIAPRTGHPTRHSWMDWLCCLSGTQHEINSLHSNRRPVSAIAKYTWKRATMPVRSDGLTQSVKGSSQSHRIAQDRHCASNSRVDHQQFRECLEDNHQST